MFNIADTLHRWCGEARPFDPATQPHLATDLAEAFTVGPLPWHTSSPAPTRSSAPP